MTDRELLEAAARAAGIKLHVWGKKGAENFADMSDPSNHRLWNPLRDRADAFDLQLRLHMGVQVNGDDHPQEPNRTIVSITMPDGTPHRLVYTHVAGAEADTMRAIVRAAALMAPAP
jgi:hypothetical protein